MLASIVVTGSALQFRVPRGPIETTSIWVAAPEEGRGHVVDRRAEVRVVEEVEQIGAGLEREALVEFKSAADGQGDLSSAESVEDVASEVTLDRAGEDGEGGLVQAPAATFGSGHNQPNRNRCIFYGTLHYVLFDLVFEQTETLS